MPIAYVVTAFAFVAGLSAHYGVVGAAINALIWYGIGFAVVRVVRWVRRRRRVEASSAGKRA